MSLSMLGLLVCIFVLAVGPRQLVTPVAGLTCVVLLHNLLVSSGSLLPIVGLTAVALLVFAGRATLGALGSNGGNLENFNPDPPPPDYPLPAPAEAERNWWRILNEESDPDADLSDVYGQMADRLEAVYDYRPDRTEFLQYFLIWDCADPARRRPDYQAEPQPDVDADRGADPDIEDVPAQLQDEVLPEIAAWAARIREDLPGEIGNWTEQHRNAHLCGPGEPEEATNLLCWRVQADDGIHTLTVRTTASDLIGHYDVHYSWHTYENGDRSEKIYHHGFASRAAAVAYAVYWIQSYPDGGPGTDLDENAVPDPQQAPPLRDLLEVMAAQDPAAVPEPEPNQLWPPPDAFEEDR